MAETTASGGPIDPKVLQMFQDISNNPSDVVVGQFRGYLEDFIRITVGSQKNWMPPVGTPLVLMTDLTAQTGEYVYTDEVGVQYLYANGVAVSQTTYADLYAFWGANAWGADVGATFLLPDCRGRSLFFCGTNAAADLGDNDGVAEASRQAKHSPSIASLTVTGAPGVGSLALSSNGAVQAGTGIASGSNLGTTTNAITGAPSLGTLDIGGSVGSGMSSDGPAHLFIGSLLVRY